MKSTFDAREILQKGGYRATPGRIKILEQLSKERQPQTVAQLHASLGSKEIDQVTLYRALEVFVASNIVRRIDLQQGRSHYYELADDHHHHLICTSCGTVKDFEACDIEKVADKALKQVRGFATVNSHAFELFGLCTTCVKSN
ncbi:MAG: Fur family transcriptional regulator [Minisyncoccia bacterium]